MHKPDIHIRALEPDDAAQVGVIFAQPRAIWGTLQVPFASVESRRKWLEAGPDGDTRLAAVIDGTVIGIAGLHRETNPRRAHAAGVGMAVHDDFAGRGAGRLLLTALIDKAENWLNIQRIELTVWIDNASAIALYESMGFEREGVLRRHAFRDGALVDALTMARLRG
jgi:L-phenylalanine/L-methionine N-acetyltransferase